MPGRGEFLAALEETRAGCEGCSAKTREAVQALAEALTGLRDSIEEFGAKAAEYAQEVPTGLVIMGPLDVQSFWGQMASWARERVARMDRVVFADDPSALAAPAPPEPEVVGGAYTDEQGRAVAF